MSTIAQQAREITGGVDTHKDTHTAAAIDSAGRPLGAEQFEATAAGYRKLLAWLHSFGTLVLVGVEGTGAYGAGLARYLHEKDVSVVEIDRPDRKARRWQGKSDPVDAEAADHAVERKGDNNRFDHQRDRCGEIELGRVLNPRLPRDRERQHRRLKREDVEQRVKPVLVKQHQADEDDAAGEQMGNVESELRHPTCPAKRSAAVSRGNRASAPRP